MHLLTYGMKWNGCGCRKGFIYLFLLKRNIIILFIYSIIHLYEKKKGGKYKTIINER